MKIQFAKQDKLSEVYNSNTVLKYSFLDKNYKGLHTPVQCKDFLTDVVWGEVTNSQKDIYVYSFNYKPLGKLLNNKEFIMGINYLEQDISDRVSGIKWILNVIENKLKFADRLEYSKVELDENKTGIAITSDIRWLSIPYLFSFYTAIIRIAHLANTGEDISDFLVRIYASDKIHINDKKMIDTFLFIIGCLDRKLLFESKYENFISLSHCHNSSGVVSMNYSKLANNPKKSLQQIYNYNTAKELTE